MRAAAAGQRCRWQRQGASARPIDLLASHARISRLTGLCSHCTAAFAGQLQLFSGCDNSLAAGECAAAVDELPAKRHRARAGDAGGVRTNARELQLHCMQRARPTSAAAWKQQGLAPAKLLVCSRRARPVAGCRRRHRVRARMLLRLPTRKHKQAAAAATPSSDAGLPAHLSPGVRAQLAPAPSSLFPTYTHAHCDSAAERICCSSSAVRLPIAGVRRFTILSPRLDGASALPHHCASPLAPPAFQLRYTVRATFGS